MRLRYAMVCSSNQNRSMEAHWVLKREGFDVSSYGTGTHVKLPGPTIREPNVYDFGTPYKLMYDELRRKDPELYKRNGILLMLKRNLGVKTAPQRWQLNAPDGHFDVVFTFEEKVFDMVVQAMGLLDFLVGNEACEVEDHSPAVAGQMYKAAGVDVPSVSPTGREGQGLEVRPPLPENTGDLVVSPAGDDFDPHGYMLEEQDSSRQRQVDLEDIGSDDDQEPCVDGPSVLGKRSSISVEDYELPTPKSKKVLFPASPPLGTNLVRRYGGLQMAPHGSTIMALPACGNTVQPAAFVGTPSGQRFVPAWSFCVGDNGQTAGSVRDFMDNVVPPQLVMQSKLQGTSELLDDADMSLFHGFMGHILARQRLCEDHENLKVNYSDLKKEVESMAVVRKDLEAEREIVSSRDREISDLSAKMSDLEKERDGLVRKAQEYEDILAAKDKELATVAKTLEVERQAVESQSQQLDAAVQGRKDLLAVFPQLFKLLLDHPDVMNLMLEVNRAAHVFGKHIVGTKLRSVAGDAVLPFLDPLVESQMRAANALFEKKNFPILERIVQDLNISIEDLLAIVTPPSV